MASEVLRLMRFGRAPGRLAAVWIVATVLAGGCAGSGSTDDAATPSNAWALDGNGDALGGEAALTFAGTVARGEEAVAFDGVTGFARTESPGPVDTTRSFSVTAWVNLGRHVPSTTAVSQIGDVAAAFYLSYINGAWAFVMKTADTSRGDVTVRALSGPAVPDPTEWVHLAGVYNHEGREIRLYVNGERAGAAAFTATWQATGPLTIGRAKGNGTAQAFWPGAIADVRTYRRALGEAAVRDVLDEGRPKGPPPEPPSPPPGFHCPYDGGACLGPLTAGTYTTRVFAPSITYAVPAGWTNGEDLLGNFLLQLREDHRFIGIYRNIAAPHECEERLDAGVGRTVDALTTWLRAHPDLETTVPRPVTVGGLRGVRLDVSAPPDAIGCYGRGVPLIVGGDPSSLTHDVPRGGTVRLYLLAYDKGNIVIEISPEGGSLKEYLQKVIPVIESLRFGA